MSDNALAKLDQANMRMLAEIRTVKDAKKVVDLAESARYFASKVKLGLRARDLPPGNQTARRARRRAHS